MELLELSSPVLSADPALAERMRHLGLRPEEFAELQVGQRVQERLLNIMI